MQDPRDPLGKAGRCGGTRISLSLALTVSCTTAFAKLGMTLGAALFPGDGQDADSLLRQADAAMYVAKAHKGDRARWWTLDASALQAAAPDDGQPLDAYGPQAQALAGRLGRSWVALGVCLSGFSAASFQGCTQVNRPGGWG